jgi:hypothetical protein
MSFSKNKKQYYKISSDKKRRVVNSSIKPKKRAFDPETDIKHCPCCVYSQKNKQSSFPKPETYFERQEREEKEKADAEEYKKQNECKPCILDPDIVVFPLHGKPCEHEKDAYKLQKARSVVMKTPESDKDKYFIFVREDAEFFAVWKHEHEPTKEKMKHLFFAIRKS